MYDKNVKSTHIFVVNDSMFALPLPFIHPLILLLSEVGSVHHKFFCQKEDVYLNVEAGA
jgi:hypothetical protein